MASFIKIDQISGMIDACIKDLHEGKSAKLRDLASLFRSLAITTENDIFMSLYPTLGSYGSVVNDFQKLVLLAPMITSEEKSKYRNKFDEITSKGKIALEKLKYELSQSEPNYKEIVILTAMLTKGWNELAEEMSPFRIRTSE